jgi:hypothetical protein
MQVTRRRVATNITMTTPRCASPIFAFEFLLVYRITAIHAEGQLCSGELNCCNLCCSTAHHIIEPLLPSLLKHDSNFSEAHFRPLTQSRPLLLHTHTSTPFTSSPYERSLNLTLYTSPDCPVASLRLHIDWWGTLGRAGT